jgi:hypothetical protein
MMKDFENSANSGVLLLEFVLGLPYLQESASEIYTNVEFLLNKHTGQKGDSDSHMPISFL